MPHLAGPPNRSDLLLYETYQIFIAIYTLYYMGTTERTRTAWKRVRGGEGKKKRNVWPEPRFERGSHRDKVCTPER